MLMHKVLAYPVDEVVFEYPLDKLVEEVRGYQLVDIRTREMFSEWLTDRMSNGIAMWGQGWDETYLDILDDPILLP